MEFSPLILSIAAFVAIILLYLVLSSFLDTKRSEHRIISRAERLSEKIHGPDYNQVKKKNIGRLQKILGLGPKEKKVNKGGIYADTPIFYQRAGIYNKATIQFYQTLRVILLFTPITLLLVSYLVYHRPLNNLLILLTLATSIACYFAPILWLRLIAKNRYKELDRSFPDAMDLLMVCVEAGMGLDSAIRRVSQEISITSPELSKEFKILSLELKTGRSRNDCLKNLAHRTNLAEVDSLVNLLIHADKYGTGVAKALRIHAEEMRQRRYARLEALAAKLPVKLVVPLILFIFPSFFVVIAGPAAIQVLRVIIQGQGR